MSKYIDTYEIYKRALLMLPDEVDGAFSLREKAVLEFLQGFAMPTLKDILRSGNPNEFKKWGGNYCRQGAFICKALLDEMLTDFKWTLYDADFEDTDNGVISEYNHAYVFGKHRDGRRVIVDLTRVTHTNGMFLVKKNSYQGLDSYDNMKCIRMKSLDYDELMMEYEYFTHIRSDKLIELVKESVCNER